MIQGRFLFSMVVVFFFISCNDNSKKETELLKKENELLRREFELNTEKQEIGKTPIKKIDVKKETQKLFDKYSSEIEKSKGAVIANSEFIIGDLNDDGLEDAIAFFILTPAEGGNMIIGQEMIVYLNEGDKMKVVARYNPEKTFRPIEIKNNKIHIIEYEYAADDFPNRPSIEKHNYLILNGNKLTLSRVYN